LEVIAQRSDVVKGLSRTRGDIITDDAYEKCIEQKGVKFFCAGPVSDHQRLVDVYFGSKPEGNIDASALVVDGESLMHVAVDDTTGLWKTPILQTRVYAIGRAASSGRLRLPTQTSYRWA
jgi:hypothetical protein